MAATLKYIPFWDDVEHLLPNGQHFCRVTNLVTQTRKYRKSKRLAFSRIRFVDQRSRKQRPDKMLPTGQQNSIREVARLLKQHASEDYCRALEDRIRWRFEGLRLRLVAQ